VTTFVPCPISGRARWHDGTAWRYDIPTTPPSEFLRAAATAVAVAAMVAAALLGTVWAARYIGPHPAITRGAHLAEWDVDVDTCQVSPIGLATANGRVRNTLDRAAQYVINVRFFATLDPDTTLDDAQTVVRLPPGGAATWTAAGRTPTTVDVTCQVVDAGRSAT